MLRQRTSGTLESQDSQALMVMMGLGSDGGRDKGEPIGPDYLTASQVTEFRGKFNDLVVAIGSTQLTNIADRINSLTADQSAIKHRLAQFGDGREQRKFSRPPVILPPRREAAKALPAPKMSRPAGEPRERTKLWFVLQFIRDAGSAGVTTARINDWAVMDSNSIFFDGAPKGKIVQRVAAFLGDLFRKKKLITNQGTARKALWVAVSLSQPSKAGAVHQTAKAVKTKALTDEDKGDGRGDKTAALLELISAADEAGISGAELDEQAASHPVLNPDQSNGVRMLNLRQYCARQGLIENSGGKTTNARWHLTAAGEKRLSRGVPSTLFVRRSAPGGKSAKGRKMTGVEKLQAELRKGQRGDDDDEESGPSCQKGRCPPPASSNKCRVQSGNTPVVDQTGCANLEAVASAEALVVILDQASPQALTAAEVVNRLMASESIPACNVQKLTDLVAVMLLESPALFRRASGSSHPVKFCLTMAGGETASQLKNMPPFSHLASGPQAPAIPSDPGCDQAVIAVLQSAEASMSFRDLLRSAEPKLQAAGLVAKPAPATQVENMVRRSVMSLQAQKVLAVDGARRDEKIRLIDLSAVSKPLSGPPSSRDSGQRQTISGPDDWDEAVLELLADAPAGSLSTDDIIRAFCQGRRGSNNWVVRESSSDSAIARSLNVCLVARLEVDDKIEFDDEEESWRLVGESD